MKPVIGKLYSIESATHKYQFVARLIYILNRNRITSYLIEILDNRFDGHDGNIDFMLGECHDDYEMLKSKLNGHNYWWCLESFFVKELSKKEAVIEVL